MSRTSRLRGASCVSLVVCLLLSMAAGMARAAQEPGDVERPKRAGRGGANKGGATKSGRQGNGGKGEPTTKPVKKTPPDPKTVIRIERLVKYYAREYGAHLQNRDWFVRALSVIALSRIDAPEMTASLLKVLAEDKDPLVRLYAWEALHARTPSLTAEQHRAWVAGGIDTALTGVFRGDLRAPLLSAMASYGSAGFDGKAAKWALAVLNYTDHTDPQDSRTLTALRGLIAAWRDPDLIRRIAVQFGRGRGASNRAEYVLGGLSKQIEPIGSVNPEKPTSPAAWGKARAAWLAWLRQAEPTAAADGDNPRYKGTSTLIPAAARVEDPDNPEWRKDLELDKLRINDFDLVFCIDATGSMGGPMQWVARAAGNMMRAFRLACREPRIGVVYYRHEVLPGLQKPCCVKYNTGRAGLRFQTLSIPLTGAIPTLAQKMLKIDPRSGTYLHPGGAVHGGMYTALTKQPWKKSVGAKKIIVLIGDSPVTPGNEQAAQVLAASAAKKGFVVHAITLKNLPSYEAVVAKGGGRSMLCSFGKGQVKKPAKKPGNGPVKKPGSKPGNKVGNNPAKAKPGSGVGEQIAKPLAGVSSYRMIVGEIIRSMLPVGYHHRVDPLVNILLVYAEAPVPPGARSR